MSNPLSCRGPVPCCQPRICSSTSMFWSMTRSAPGPWPSRPGRARCRDAAHGEWFYGFRLAVKTDLGSRVVRAWGIVPAAVNERGVAEDLLDAGPPPRDLLADKG